MAIRIGSSRSPTMAALHRLLCFACAVVGATTDENIALEPSRGREPFISVLVEARLFEPKSKRSAL